jgi:Lon protease-like protein
MVALPLLLSIAYLQHVNSFAGHASTQVQPSTLPWSASFATTPRNNRRTFLHMTADDYNEDNDEGNPLSKGINSVSWLPSVSSRRAQRSVIDSPPQPSSETAEDDVVTLPLFPLGGIVYTPNSEHILNIFEPRYRQMYNDILMNGSKRFVVSMCHPSEEGRFASTGVLFSLEELKEVSELTDDQVKYICNHRVTGRVKLHEVVNPEAWATRETYLKVKGTIIDDTGYYDKKMKDEEGKDEKISKKLVDAMLSKAKADSMEKSPEEEALLNSFTALVELQHEMEEDVRFTRASVKSFGIAEGTDVDPNLWTSIRLWQSYAEQRLVATQNEMQKEFQEKLVQFLKEEMGNGESGEELPSAIGFEDLSVDLQKELIDLQERMAAELKPLLLEQTLSMQKLLEAENHTERLELMRYFIDSERKRLLARKSLKDLFSGASKSSTTSSSSSVATKESDSQNKEETEMKAATQNSYFDDGDAWQ